MQSKVPLARNASLREEETNWGIEINLTYKTAAFLQSAKFYIFVATGWEQVGN